MKDREATLQNAIAEAEFYEDGLSLFRRQCREWKFQISAQLLQGVIDGARAGLDYAAIAAAIIRSALPLVMQEISRRFGQIEETKLAIMAMGRLGAKEMTLTSDLDLVFIYDCKKDAVSDGAKQLDGHQYFSRFSQELINALSSLTAEGRCYEVDMRLRPSGNLALWQCISIVSPNIIIKKRGYGNISPWSKAGSSGGLMKTN